MPEEMISDLHEPNMLVWIYNALGIRYVLLLPLVAGITFLVTLILIMRGKGASLSGALLFVVPMPLLVGALAFFDGMISSFHVIARSSVAPRPSELATGISMSLVAPLIGLLLMAPSFLLAALALSIRALNQKTNDG